MLKKILAAVLSTIVFSAVMGLLNYFTSSAQTFENFWIPMVFFAMYAAPVYLIAGIPISYLIDKVVNKINNTSQLTRHYTRYGLFILAGIVVAFIYVAILRVTEDEQLLSRDLLTYIIGGVIASLIYYYVSLLFTNKESK
ncbi:hypothetical protein [Ornithinibacillus xuwenensis]|uniref:Uncharacterized protein n=1 Tax=Ornithinibacillus xuwenensis TaxID=3144668 RepID=A0ABU9XLN3_9BACI